MTIAAPETIVAPGPPPLARPDPLSSVADPAGMRREEYARLRELLEACQPRRTLEIGMAHGGSTEQICSYLRDCDGRMNAEPESEASASASANARAHVAIDPFQRDEATWNGCGLDRIERAGLAGYCTLIEEPDYLALPRLVEESRRFDFILVDGWHSFDYTLIDLFYADLLLEPSGVVAIHDTGWPAVHKACRFLETHKPYQRISPPISVIRKSWLARLARRTGQILRGPQAFAEAQNRRTKWFALAAYRKRADHQTPNDFHTPF